MNGTTKVSDSLKNSWVSQLDTNSLQKLTEFAAIVKILNREDYSEKSVKITLKFPNFEKSFFLSKKAEQWANRNLVNEYKIPLVWYILAYRFNAYEFIDDHKNSFKVKINESYVFLPKSRCALKIGNFVIYEIDFVNWILKKREENKEIDKEAVKNGKSKM